MLNISHWIHHFTYARDSKTLLALAVDAFSDIGNTDHVDIQITDTSQSDLIQPLAAQLASRNLMAIDQHSAELLQMPGFTANPGDTFVAILPLSRHSSSAGWLYFYFSKNNAPVAFPTEPQEAALTIISEAFLLAWQSISIQEAITRQLTEKTAEALEIRLQSEQALRVKNRFLSATSHDLRQPLQQIQNLTGLLKKQIQQPNSLALLSRMTHLIEDMDEVMKTLLNLDRLTQGIIQPDMTNFAVAELFSTLENDFHDLAAGNQLTLTFEKREIQIYSDKKLLLQILRNLLSNAIKYTQHGSIGIRLQPQDKHVQLVVFDTGPGILAEQQKMIFDPFYQLESSLENDGFGLGLSIVKALCETLRIPVTIHSEPGQGTEFRLTLSRSRADFEPQLPSSVPLIQTQPTAKYNILYLEDDPILQESMTLLLTMADFNPLGSSHLEQACAEMEQRHFQPDLILTDKKLSFEQDGVQVVKQIRRKFNKAIPAILLTGYTESRITHQALQDVQRVLTKPIDIDLLTCEIKQILNSP